MRKVLLIGKLSDIVRDMNDILSEEFIVQLSSLQLENIQGMIKIAKPEMVILCLVGADRIDTEILQWMNENVRHLPVIVVTSHENWQTASVICTGKQFTPVFPPINNDALTNMCFWALRKDGEAPVNAGINQTNTKKLILLIDDNAAALRTFKGMLEEKYDTILATSGEMGIQKAIDVQPDLILLDYEMPGMNGNATFEMLLQIDSIKHIPVIFLTGVSDGKRVMEVIDKHPAGYMLKPPEKETLIEQIEAVLN
ncbi:MAG: response regulator, partial [bacterium]|nr:response regulator [bacterium]